MPARNLYAASSYSAFVANDAVLTDTTAFGISSLEAQTMDTQMALIMEGSYVALHRTSDLTFSRMACRASLRN